MNNYQKEEDPIRLPNLGNKYKIDRQRIIPNKFIKQ